jgi:hypothetical protein
MKQIDKELVLAFFLLVGIFAVAFNLGHQLGTVDFFSIIYK